MSYYNDLSFASGYYTIESNGDLVLLADIPENIENKVRALWPDLRQRVIDRQKRGLYSSRDPHVNHKGDGKIIKLEK